MLFTVPCFLLAAGILVTRAQCTISFRSGSSTTH